MEVGANSVQIPQMQKSQRFSIWGRHISTMYIQMCATFPLLNLYGIWHVTEPYIINGPQMLSANVDLETQGCKW